MIVHHSVISEKMMQEKYLKPDCKSGEDKSLIFLAVEL